MFILLLLCSSIIKSVQCQQYFAIYEPTMVEQRCGLPPVVENGKFSNGTDAIGESLSLICDRGFSLSGNGRIICQDNTWWSFPGTCEKLAYPSIEQLKFNVVFDWKHGLSSTTLNEHIEPVVSNAVAEFNYQLGNSWYIFKPNKTSSKMIPLAVYNNLKFNLTSFTISFSFRSIGDGNYGIYTDTATTTTSRNEGGGSLRSRFSLSIRNGSNLLVQVMSTDKKCYNQSCETHCVKEDYHFENVFSTDGKTIEFVTLQYDFKQELLSLYKSSSSSPSSSVLVGQFAQVKIDQVITNSIILGYAIEEEQRNENNCKTRRNIFMPKGAMLACLSIYSKLLTHDEIDRVASLCPAV